MPGGACQQRGRTGTRCAGKSDRETLERGRSARDGRAPPLQQRGAGARLRCGRARGRAHRECRSPEPRVGGTGTGGREAEPVSPPPARSARPSIPRARGETPPVPPPRPAAADPPQPAAPRCAPSPAAAPGPAACGALRGARSYLRALSGAARCLRGCRRCPGLPGGLWARRSRSLGRAGRADPANGDQEASLRLGPRPCGGGRCGGALPLRDSDAPAPDKGRALMRKVRFAPLMLPRKGDASPSPWEHQFAEELPTLISPGSVGGVLLGKEDGWEGEKELGVGFAEEGAGTILSHQMSAAQVLQEATLHQVTTGLLHVGNHCESMIHNAESKNHTII